MDRMKELIEILNKAAEAYYQNDSQIMTDYEYDKLYDELLQLEKKTGVILSKSPTQKVGFEVLGSLTKIKHESKMLSLDKTKDILKLKDWIGENEGILSWKLDGLTIVLKYKNGEFFQAVTRGNGEIGEDITHNARFFKNIPLKIKYKEELVLRGEGLISYKDFFEINENLEEKYKNPRNLCSGTVRQLNSEISAKRNVMFYAFTLVKADDVDFCDLKMNQLKWLEDIGFNSVERKIVTKDNIEETVLWFEKNIEKNDFASDGLVLTYNSISYSESLGRTSKFPKDSIAFKWKDEVAETTLNEIFWNTSRTGLINPIAIFDSVELEGTTVNRASVHNVSIVEELKLGIGDKIKVYKANMIIPQIAENITQKGGINIPKECPVCGGETEIRIVKEGKALYCTNPNCFAQRLRSLAHFVSRDAMNIEGLSEETLKKLIELKFIYNYTDIYTISKFENDIKNMEGFGERSYNNLINSIEQSKNVRLPNFIYALGINHVGLSNAKLLCRNFDYNLEKIKNLSEEELAKVDGFGEVIAHSINKYFSDNKNLELLNKILDFLNFIEPELEPKGGILSNMSFVITGDLTYFKNRAELQFKIEALGGKTTSTVTKLTTYLINNNNMSESSKNKKAHQLGIPIITEHEFVEKFIN